MSAALFEPTPLAWRAWPAQGVARQAGGALAVLDFDAPALPAEDAAAALAAATDAAREDAARLGAARLEAARASGFAEGETVAAARAAHSLAAREAAALAAIAAALDQATAAARSAARDGAQCLAGLLLAALAAALPAASGRLAAEQAARLAVALEPLLAEGLAVRLCVAAGHGAVAAARIADPRVSVAEDAALAPGDARATWRGGGASLSLAARQAAVAEMLGCFGLQES